MTPIRVAIVGLGKIAEDQHVPVIGKDPRFELAAVVSQRGKTVGTVPAFRTLDEALAHGTAIDAVVVCTPPGVRHAIADAALRAGKHVMLEKPPAATVTEAQALVSTAAQANRVLFATWHSRFNGAVETTRRRLAGARITSLTLTWKESVRKWHPGQDWVFEPGGFGVFDPGINAFSILTHIMPAPLTVRSAVLHEPANRATPIAASLVFGCTAALPDAPLTGALDWLQETGETWTIDVTTAAGERLTLTEGGSKLAINGSPAEAAPLAEYEGIYARFAELVAAGRSDSDLSPLTLVADAFLIGKRVTAPTFDW